MVDVEGTLTAAKGMMWVVFAIFVLLLFGKELRPLVELLINWIIKAVRSI